LTQRFQESTGGPLLRSGKSGFQVIHFPFQGKEALQYAKAVREQVEVPCSMLDLAVLAGDHFLSQSIKQIDGQGKRLVAAAELGGGRPGSQLLLQIAAIIADNRNTVRVHLKVPGSKPCEGQGPVIAPDTKSSNRLAVQRFGLNVIRLR